jgi:hypothetical protein
MENIYKIFLFLPQIKGPGAFEATRNNGTAGTPAVAARSGHVCCTRTGGDTTQGRTGQQNRQTD